MCNVCECQDIVVQAQCVRPPPTGPDSLEEMSQLAERGGGECCVETSEQHSMSMFTSI